MRVVVLSSDTPYPPNRGGRADVWRRILGLRALGHQVMLVHLFESDGAMAPRAEDLPAIDLVVAARFSFPIKRGAWRTLRQLAGVWHTPWQAATRIPDTVEMVELGHRLDGFAPTLVWLEGPWFGPLAQSIAAARSLRYAYRSHNIEHQYLWRQAAVAVRARDRLAWRLACIGVRRLEERLTRGAAAVFDISMDDFAYWRERGVQHQHWLPPLPEVAVADCAAAPVAGDVVFLGNLGTPNNMRGVEFLVREVWPQVRRQLPAARLALVGSNPTPYVRGCIATCDGGELRDNVTDPMAHVLGARVQPLANLAAAPVRAARAVGPPEAANRLHGALLEPAVGVASWVRIAAGEATALRASTARLVVLNGQPPATARLATDITGRRCSLLLPLPEATELPTQVLACPAR